MCGILWDLFEICNSVWTLSGAIVFRVFSPKESSLFLSFSGRCNETGCQGIQEGVQKCQHRPDRGQDSFEDCWVLCFDGLGFVWREAPKNCFHILMSMSSLSSMN